MSVRVVARVRPLQEHENPEDVIVKPASHGSGDGDAQAVVRIPNPKNDKESFSFQFNSVYDARASQQELFEAEIAPTVKSLFQGVDVTLFAYGVTGTGKTHTMRGGKTLATRGIIPRLLSAVYRRSRKTEKDGGGETGVEVVMSYYEIYNDKVYDLFEASEKRTAGGLPIREHNGKTVVVGLTERPCSTLKHFEQLYDEANVNRSTSATKLNAHSSRSHAVLCVKVTQTAGGRSRTSTASAIDLAGSEDNRRTENGKERMVESASINRSLFVLAQCVEAISKKQARIPYRESKMTRILSLGQNNGVTVMILNLAPVRSYHLDTLSSLNFANRTKKIETRGVENEAIFQPMPQKGATNFATAATSTAGRKSPLQRQPLRPLMNAHNSALLGDAAAAAAARRAEKPVRTFFVFPDKEKAPRQQLAPLQPRDVSPQKRRLEDSTDPIRPLKTVRRSKRSSSSIAEVQRGSALSSAAIEALIEAKVEEKLAVRTLNAETSTVNSGDISDEVQRRLLKLEERIAEREQRQRGNTGRAEGLQYLIMAKQHRARRENANALRMYRLALPFFPENEKLRAKIAALENASWSTKGGAACLSADKLREQPSHSVEAASPVRDRGKAREEQEEESSSDEPSSSRARGRGRARGREVGEGEHSCDPDSPRTRALLRVINTRDVARIKTLKGVGTKRAEAIVSALGAAPHETGAEQLREVAALKGFGWSGVEKMKMDLVAG